MWLVKRKSDKDSKLWSTEGAYDNERGAIVHASQLGDIVEGYQLLCESPMIIVTDPSGKIICGVNEMSANGQ